MANKAEPVHNPSRVLIGHCPSCGGVVVILNDYEIWPFASCPCGWADGTDALVNRHRIEHGFIINNGYPERVRPPHGEGPPTPSRPAEIMAVDLTSEIL